MCLVWGLALAISRGLLRMQVRKQESRRVRRVLVCGYRKLG